MGWRLYTLARHMANPQGQVFILVAGSLALLLGFAALSVDVGHYTNERQRLQNAVDAAALAGAQYLPLRPASDADAAQMLADAEGAARKFAELNDERLKLSTSELNISFGCLVREDETAAGRADPIEVQTLCPHLVPVIDGFTCLDQRCFQACPPLASAGQRQCNTIEVSARKKVDRFLAPVVGADDHQFTEFASTACRGGTCGAPAKAAITIMIDRSTSMGAPGSPPTRLDQAKQGARSILEADDLLDPELHVVALATTPRIPNIAQGIIQAPLTPTYGEVIGAIEGLETNHLLTDLHTPIEEATNHLTTALLAQGKDKILILLTDGAPSARASLTGTPCADAIAAAETAEAQDLQIFTIFYGDQRDEECPANPSLKAFELLANMASGNATADRICDIENDDGDNFFCAPDGDDLAPIFRQIIRRVTVGDGSSLIDLTGFM